MRGAEGPVVLPLRDWEVAKLKEMASNPQTKPAREIAVSFDKHPKIYKLGLLALMGGKDVSALFTGVMMKRGSEQFRGKVGVAFHHQTNREQSKLILADATADFEAERMLTAFERLRKNKPALIIAEDNQAIELGRLFRVKITKATAHSPSTKTIVRRVMRGFQRVARKRMG